MTEITQSPTEEYTHEQVWQKCLDLIVPQFDDRTFNTWFKPIVPISLVEGVFTIRVPSSFFYEYMEENFASILQFALQKVIGSVVSLNYAVVVDQGNAQNGPVTMNVAQNNTTSYSGPTKPTQQFNPFQNSQQGNVVHSNLNPLYTFENYIEGSCNRFARSAGLAIAEKPGISSFNPLMIYGGVGLGKTHLVQAIGNALQNNFQKTVLYVTSEIFLNQFFEAIQRRDIQAFKNFYMLVDVLIIDDVQFFAGKEATQECFFHIFNHLHQNGKQIIMTTDRAPKDLKGLEDRLVSRFKWGVTADIQQPDMETKIVIIQTKMRSEGIEIPTNVIEYLAYSVDTNVRELEGVLSSVIIQSTLMRVEIDLELAKTVLKSLIQNIDTEVSIDYIQKCISEKYTISVEDIKDKTRKKEIVAARQIAMYLAKNLTDLSLKSIGYHFGGRDHTTVMHAIASVSELMMNDTEYKSTIEELQKKLKMKQS